MLLRNVYNYIRHSGLGITIIFNPFHWRYVPYFYYGVDAAWPSADVQLAGSWLFLKIQLLISDGSW
jgi:hypothetical protein